MNRLTNKIFSGDYIFIDGEKTCPNEVATKLGKLEDIEELGIDLNTIYQATKGAYLKVGNEIKFYENGRYTFGEKTIYFYNCYEEIGKWETDMIRLLKDYGETWALTREELEK